MLGTKNIYLYKKYDDFQFSIINESKALKAETGTKMSGKNCKKLIFLGNSNLIRESAEAILHGCSGENSQENTFGGVLLSER